MGSSKHRRTSAKSIIQTDSLNPTLEKNEVALKRHLGLFSGVCFIIGTIIGSGIFISPKGILAETKSVGLSLIIWTVCGLISILGALCYAEIGAIIPRNGAEVVYMKEGIGSVHERTGDVLAYLFIWTTTFIVTPSTIAVLSLTFSQYLLSGVMDDCEPSRNLVKLLAIFTILMLMNINALSVSAANRLNIIFVICKVLTIVTVIIVGLVRIGQGLCLVFSRRIKHSLFSPLGHTQQLKNSFEGTTTKPFSVALAFYKGLFAYGGWNCVNSVTEELKNPKRNLWLSIVLGVPLVIIFYVLANISYFTAMNKNELLSSDAVAVTWGQVALGPVVRLLPILISISALGSSSAVLFGGARCCMVGAQYGYLPELFAYIQTQRLTPLPVVILLSLLSIVYCIPSNLYTLIDFFSFSMWIFFGLTFVATLCCKFTKKHAERVISVPIPLVIVIILISIYLVIVPVISYPSFGFLIASLVILSGLLFYYPFVYRKIEFDFMKKLNSSFQVFFKLQRAQTNIE